jgi:CubicO group peptidase (beta-lactamase class C family)
MMNPKHTRSVTLFAVLLLTLASMGRAQTAPAGAPQDLDAFAARVLKEFEVPGLAVAIVKDGKVVLDDGSIEQMKMAAVSPLTDFSFDFQDLLFTPAATGERKP